jgi:hypothetical protein
MFEERIVDAVLLPGEVLENGNKTADISVELRALIGENGSPVYEVVATTLDGRRFGFWVSKPYDHHILASTEFFRHTQVWVPEREYEKAIREDA